MVAIGANQTSLAVAVSNGDGTFHSRFAVPSDAQFLTWASLSGAKPFSGDFNGDGRTDIGITGVSGWASVPIAASGSQGDTIVYRVFNTPVGDFPGWAAAAGAKPVTGDFNGDRRDDVALVGGAGWGSIPVAFFRGDGTSITVTNVAVPDFPSWATTAGAMPFTGDFNGDGLSDIALIGPSGWQSMPIAFSNGDGSFKVTNFPIGGGFNALAASGAKPVAGRFHPASIQTWDVALVGGTAVGNNIPVAISNGDGTFTVHNDSNNALSAFTAPGCEVWHEAGCR